MKKLFLLLALLPALVFAQNAREEIRNNIGLSGSNYYAYQPFSDKLTPTPKGYEPFYMSHYARHGSRWLCGSSEYTTPLKTLKKADSYGKLTPEGQEIMRRVEKIQLTSIKRCGDLTTVGERQHHGIGKRMAKNFPEIFKVKDTQIDARSTVVRRCILSMIAECEELAAANPNATFHNDTSDSLQYYLNENPSKKMSAIQSALGNVESEWYQKLYKPERLMEYIFNDPQYVKDSIGSRKALMRQLFNVARGMQSHDIDNDMWYIFTEDEIFDMWKEDNIEWYCSYGGSPDNPFASYCKKTLCENFLNTADTIVNSRTFHGATLRFGHEVCVLPLACFFELGDAGAKVAVKDFDKLHESFRNYTIFPMASNVQLVFYRAKKGNGPVLLKALLNEKEVKIGDLPTDNFPYYKWSDFSQYFRNKLALYTED